LELSLSRVPRPSRPRTHFDPADGHPDLDERCTALSGEFDGIGDGSHVDVLGTSDAAHAMSQQQVLRIG